MDYVKAGGVVLMKFTTQAWLISLFYDCPPGLGLHCPNEVRFIRMISEIGTNPNNEHMY